MKRLNLGCGRDYRDGWDNWDISADVKTDIRFDISNEVWPVDQGIYDQIYCSGVLEQILLNGDLVFVMNEAHRTLKSGGKMTVVVPNAKYSNAFRDPHDVRKFTPETFNYFDGAKKEFELYGSVYGYKPWHIANLETGKNGIMTIVMQKP